MTMSTTMGRKVVAPLVLAGGVLLTGVSGGVASATPTPPWDGEPVSGQEAIDLIEAGAPLDLGSATSGAELSRDEVIEMFEHDSSLYLSGDELVYLDTMFGDDSDAAAAVNSATTNSAFDDTPRLRDIAVSAEDVANAFVLHSRPQSSHKIYLDFNGHTTDEWISLFDGLTEYAPFDLDGDESSFSTAEREWIVRWWSRVIADVDTWDVDVTTEEPPPEYLTKTGPDDTTYGMRVMVTSTQGKAGIRGSGRLRSFEADRDAPAYTFVDRETFNTDLNFIWEEYTPWVISHELGHTFGLSHDDYQEPGGPYVGYYPGHNGWAPIMGGGLIAVIEGWDNPRTVIQWSKAEYKWAAKPEDDRAIIGKVLGALDDDHSGPPTAVNSGVATAGLINSTADTDGFSFVTDGGTVEISATLPLPGKELDLSLAVSDAGGTIVASKNTPGVGPETLTFNASPGRYVITVDGVGTGDPITGYSDYSSVGAYELVVTAARTSPRPSDLIDFDGDGVGDVFTVERRDDGRYQWRYSSGGSPDWTDLRVGDEPLDQLRFGDFDGDGKTDVFTGTPTNGKYQWKYSSGGVGDWQNLLLSAYPFHLLRFGDFDGDGKTDVFAVSRRYNGNRWRYSSAGVTGWQDLGLSSEPLEQLRFGDFDGDGKTDVFTGTPTNGKYQWKYSSGGVGDWQNLLLSAYPFELLRFGDFDGDGKTDVFAASPRTKGNRWRYSAGGVGGWQDLQLSVQPFDWLRFGDFDGDGKTDVFTISTEGTTGRWKHISAGISPWLNLTTSSMQLDQLRFGYVSSQ